MSARRRSRRTSPSSASPGTRAPQPRRARAWGRAPCASVHPVGVPERRRDHVRRRGRGRAAGGVRWADCGDVPVGPMWSPERLPQRGDRQAAAAHELGALPRHARGRPFHRLPRAQGAQQARGGRRCTWCSSTPTWTTGRRRAAAASRTGPVIPQPRGGVHRRAHAVRQSAASTRPGTNIALARSRGRASSVSAGQGHAGRRPRRAPAQGRRRLHHVRHRRARPGHRAGTGTPEPGGFTYYEAKDIPAGRGAPAAPVVGMDVVEVAPMYDGPASSPPCNGARLILDAVGAVFRARAALA